VKGQKTRGQRMMSERNPAIALPLIHEFTNREERIGAIAREYARSPEGALVVSPDNRSRSEINQRIHNELQAHGIVSRNEYSVTTLAARQEMTGADRTWAAQYQIDDILRYSRGSRETGIGKGEYARVTSIDAEKNLLTVKRTDGPTPANGSHSLSGAGEGVFRGRSPQRHGLDIGMGLGLGM
jgi:hypothetical protein